MNDEKMSDMVTEGVKNPHEQNCLGFGASM